MAGRRRRPGTDILERVENTLGHSIVKDWGGRLPAVPPTLRGGPLTSSEFGTGEDGDQVLIEHVTLSGVANQTVANGGGDLSWDTPAGPPTEIRGFFSLVSALASGPVIDIPIDLTGAGIVVLGWKWGDWPTGYRMSGDIVLTLTRGATTIVETITMVHATRRGDGVTEGWEFEVGDTLTVAFPNGSGVSQTLAECTVEVMIWEVSQAASTVPQPTPDPDVVVVDMVAGGGTSIAADVSSAPVGSRLIAVVMSVDTGTTLSGPAGWTPVLRTSNATFDYGFEHWEIVRDGTDTDTPTWTWGTEKLAAAVAVVQITAGLSRAIESSNSDTFQTTHPYPSYTPPSGDAIVLNMIGMKRESGRELVPGSTDGVIVAEIASPYLVTGTPRQVAVAVTWQSQSGGVDPAGSLTWDGQAQVTLVSRGVYQ